VKCRAPLAVIPVLKLSLYTGIARLFVYALIQIKHMLATATLDL
jgi:hypothetical protein